MHLANQDASDDRLLHLRPRVRPCVARHRSHQRAARAAADLRIVVRTTAPQVAVRSDRARTRATQPSRVSPLETDTGIVQIDSLHLDAGETVRRARDVHAHLRRRVSTPKRHSSEHAQASLVVADIPPLGIAAARRAGIPAVALGNFTWDWIYSAYPGTDDVVRAIGDAYARADLALRLPMHGGFASFPTQSSICRSSRGARRATRDETRARSGFPLDERSCSCRLAATASSGSISTR